MCPNIRNSVWLVVEVPGRAADRVPELKEALRKFAGDWIAEADKNIRGEPYAIDVDHCEAGELRIFLQKK